MSQFSPIDDKTKVKDTLALGVPTCATTEVHNLFHNQLVPLINVAMATADEDAEAGRVRLSFFFFLLVLSEPQRVVRTLT